MLKKDIKTEFVYIGKDIRNGNKDVATLLKVEDIVSIDLSVVKS